MAAVTRYMVLSNGRVRNRSCRCSRLAQQSYTGHDRTGRQVRFLFCGTESDSGLQVSTTSSTLSRLKIKPNLLPPSPRLSRLDRRWFRSGYFRLGSPRSVFSVYVQPAHVLSRLLIYMCRQKLDRALEKPQAVMQRIGLRLIQESKDEMAQSGTFEKGRSRDLLSLLVRANTAKDLPASQRLSDEDVLARELLFCSTKVACSIHHSNRGTHLSGRWARDVCCFTPYFHPAV